MNETTKKHYEELMNEIAEVERMYDLTFEEAIKVVNARTLRNIQYYMPG